VGRCVLEWVTTATNECYDYEGISESPGELEAVFGMRRAELSWAGLSWAGLSWAGSETARTD